MKKRMGLLVIATCALISFALASHTTGAWWSEHEPNHLQLADVQTVITPDWWSEHEPNH
ncbi:hypothetical protein [Tumebacillus flagellatus]|uniref:hypothetical protein n=1 Tax=Tumebacillus flagellatus TaxID=1157490 RepID=UPI0013790D9A|nr:hypothetical protein [Tumebacillus flagellatus]